MPIKVHVWPTKHKGNDIWKVAIDDVGGGPLTELKERYTRKQTAKRGALRNLNAVRARFPYDNHWLSDHGSGPFVDFIYTNPAKR